MIIAFLIWAFAAGQEDPRSIAEKLRSERPEERDDARRKLKQLGPAALPELERIAKGSDAEAAAQARTLMRVIELTRILTPRLLRSMPGVEEKLATGADGVWTDVLLEAVDRESERASSLRAEDLAPIIDRAVKGVRGLEQKKEVARAARRYALRSAAPAVHGWLKEGDQGFRRELAATLGVLGRREAIPDIVKLIDVEPYDEYFDALFMLGAKAALVGLLEHRDDHTRGAAVLQLANPDWPEVKAAVLKLLKDPVVMVRAKAARAAAAHGAKEAVPLIVELLRDEGFDPPYYALEALATLEAREAIPDILKVLDREGQIRGEAAVALARLNAKEAIPKILAHLDDPDGNAQMRIAGALASLGAKEAIPGLVKMTEDPSFVLRQLGLDSLVTLMGREAVPHVRRLLTDGNVRVSHDAIQAARKLKAKELVPDLVAMAEGGSEHLRWDAIVAAATLGGADVTPTLLKFIDDEDTGVRAGALWGLGHVGAKDHRAAIEGKLKDPQAFVRQAAAEALGDLGARESIPLIEPLLADRRQRTATAAARTLCRLGSKKGGAVLLEDPEERIYLNALRSPEAWRRLEADSRNGYREGGEKELLEEVAAQAKLTVEWPKEMSDEDRRRLAGRRDADGWKWDEPLSVWAVIRVLLPDDLDAILEGDRLRILPRDAALEFWKSWLASENR